ncbi:sulfotransferase [bacterium]|nr:sulfotransferase [bacterium]
MKHPIVDFLGIGVQRAGTTWLWRKLRQHPAIWMPPIKELHYFSRATTYPSPSHLSEKYLRDRLFGKEIYHKHFRTLMWGHIGRSIKRHSVRRLRWMSRYYFGTYDDNWYRSLFKEGEGLVKGEITPSYSILQAEDVAHIKMLFPSLKIILLLRNPIDRAWSQIRFDWTRERFRDIDDLDQIKAFIDSPKQSLRGDYVRMIDVWSSVFSEAQLFIGFYDELVGNPQKLLSDVFDFLGVQPITTPERKLSEKVNFSESIEVPMEIRGLSVGKVPSGDQEAQ